MSGNPMLTVRNYLLRSISAVHRYCKMLNKFTLIVHVP